MIIYMAIYEYLQTQLAAAATVAMAPRVQTEVLPAGIQFLPGRTNIKL